MKITQLKCPNCNADLNIYGDVKYVICEYCKTQFAIDDGVKRSEHVYIKVDEAKIKHEEIIRDIKIEELNKKKNDSDTTYKIMVWLIIASVVMFVVGALTGNL